MEECKMDFATIINLLLPYWGIIAVALVFGGYVLFQRDNAKKIILSLIIRIEEEAESLALNSGADKFQFLVDRGYQLLPTAARLLITQKMFDSLAQSLYDTAKNYLIVAKPKEVITETPILAPVSVPNIDTQPIIQTEQFNSTQPVLDEVPSIPEEVQTVETIDIPTVETPIEVIPETPIIPEVQTPVEIIPTPVSVSPIVVSEDMMKEIYNQVLAKATADAEVAIKHVIENVQKSITPTV